MKRKALLPLLLVLTLLVSMNALAIQIPKELLQGLGTSQGEPADITVKEERLNIYKSIMGMQGVYVVAVENPGTAPINLGESSVDLLDKDGAVVVNSPIYSMAPYTLQPGETGYVISSFYSISDEDAARITSHKATITGVLASEGDSISYVRLPAEASFTTSEDTDFFTNEKLYEISIVNTVENNTDKDVYDVRVFNVLRDKDGKLLSIADSMAMDVGIPAGGKILLKTNVDSGMNTKFTNEQTPVATVEAFAILEIRE